MATPSEFDDWARISAVIVGHAHLALAGLSTWATWRMSQGDPHISGLKILLLTTAVSCVPGIVAMAVPPILVLVTGAVFVPALIGLLSRTADDEREQTSAAA